MNNLPAVRSPSAVALGDGWVLRCQSCGEEGTPLEGACPTCGAAAHLPSLPTTRDRLPPTLRRLQGRIEPALLRLSTWFRRSPWFFVFFWGGLLSGLSPASLVFLVWCGWGFLIDGLFPPRRDDEPVRVLRDPSPPDQALPPGAAPRPRVTELMSTRLELSRSWWQVNKIRARRGISAHMNLRVRGYQGQRLELELRFLGPDGRYLRAALPGYKGSQREAMASHRTRRLKLDDSRFPDLWIYMPLRALALPQGLVRLEAEAELRLTCRGELLLRHRLPVDLVPLPEDLWAPDTPQLAVGPGMLLEAMTEARTLTCGVCGDADDAVTHHCPVCAAPHHPECWAYLDGCSRFGCPESPGRKQT